MMALNMKAAIIALTMFFLASLSVEGQAQTAELTSQAAHGGSINDIAFTPDGKRAVTASDDNTIKLWDLATGAVLRTLTGHKGKVTSVGVTPDGSRIVSGSEDNTVRIWDASNGRSLRTIKLLNAEVSSLSGVESVLVTVAGRRVLATGFVLAGKLFGNPQYHSMVRSFDIETGRLVKTYKTGSFFGVSHLAQTPDGKLLIGGMATANAVIIWNAKTGRVVRSFKRHSEIMLTLSVSPDGKRIVTGAYDDVAIVSDIASGKPIAKLAMDTQGDSKGTYAAAFIRGGKELAVGGWDKMLKIWDLDSKKVVWTYEKAGHPIAVSPKGDRILVAGGAGLQLLDIRERKLIGVLSGVPFDKPADPQDESVKPDKPETPTPTVTAVWGLTSVPDGRHVISTSWETAAWDIRTGRLVRRYGSKKASPTAPLGLVENGELVIAQHYISTGPKTAKRAIGVWERQSGKLLRSEAFPEPQQGYRHSMAISPDGRTILLGGGLGSTSGTPGALEFRDLENLQSGLIKPRQNLDHVQALAASPDNKYVAVGTAESRLELWDLRARKRIRNFIDKSRDSRVVAKRGSSWVFVNRSHAFSVNKVAFTPDGKRLLSASWDDQVKVWNAANGRLLWRLKAHSDAVLDIAVSPDGKHVVSGGRDNRLVVWSLVSGKRIRTLPVQESYVQTVAYSANGDRIIAGLGNGAMKVFDSDTGSLLATFTAVTAETWMVITPEGFFAASRKGLGLLKVVRELKAYSIEQFFQTLYRPDLVKEKLSGDPDGLVREAAKSIDLDKVIDSGQAPDVRILKPGPSSVIATRDVSVEAEFANRGGGIGRVEWRVDGITIAVETPPSAPAGGQALRLTRNVTLGEGENRIEVVAYNEKNLIASLPARITVTGPAPKADAEKPRLFVLALGLNDYEEESLRLKYAVPDAKALVEALKQTGKDLYREIDVTLISNADVRRDKLDTAFSTLASKATAGDVFVFFAAGHGKTLDGRYYFVPQDFRLAGDGSGKQALREAILDKGIDQEQWQTWFAGIPSRKSLLLFDTCEAGTLTGEGRETQMLERSAANDRLVQATGRTIITASAADDVALEGFRDHGVFTYSVLEALERSDGDRDGRIDVAEFAAYVHAQVIALSEKVFKLRQVPQIRLTTNYPFAAPARILPETASEITIPKQPTHQVAAAAELLVLPADGARRVRKLDANTPLTLVHTEGGWTLVARGGRPLGYVASRHLAPLQ